MLIRAMYIEDTPAHVDDFLREAAAIERFEVVFVCAGYQAAAEWLQQEGHIDIIFSDIELAGPDGLRIAKALGDCCHFFILVSGHAQYRAEAWDVGAKGYLMKPVLQDDLRMLVEKLRSIKAHGGVWLGEASYAFYRNVIDGVLTKIDLTQVIEITKGADNKNHTKICLPNKVVLVNKSITQLLEDTAASGRFIRLRGDAAVAKSQIAGIADNTVALLNGNRYVVTKEYLPALKGWIQNPNP